MLAVISSYVTKDINMIRPLVFIKKISSTRQKQLHGSWRNKYALLTSEGKYLTTVSFSKYIIHFGKESVKAMVTINQIRPLLKS